MSQDNQKNDHRALLQQALRSLEQMEAKLHASEAVLHEPIAIIGMGFRFPGDANDSASFWQLLYNGTDAITEVPSDRWNANQFYDPDPDAIGKSYSRWGGFLKQVDQFDPNFFGISPREAVSMDPQQRLLLETTWEALENSGQASSKLAGSRTGIFIGMVGSDYANMKMMAGSVHDVDAYFGTGIARSIAAGRIAYTFGLHGPAVAVDTACSSSLVALHQACQSLRLRECDMAIAGGVNLILEPSGHIITSRGRMASFDGRCKTFDSTADGYVRAEGCAMIVVKRLSDAVANGDHVLAVIMGTALNQDGRSNGLTAPNGKAQEAVIRAALEDAKLQPADISYVETHGTGTSLGDPIEVRSLGAVFGDGRERDNLLMIGSVKTNVGHLEAAAGVVGLVKIVLALKHGMIPPHLHLDTPNPYIPWDELSVTVPTRPTPWVAPNGQRRVAGLSSFGFSGTNAHMIIAEAQTVASPERKSGRTSHLFTLSARSESALRALSEKQEAYLRQNPSISLADVTYSLGTGRSHFMHRLALTASTIDQVLEKLSAWRSSHRSSGVFMGERAEKGSPEVAFLFTGQGAQYVGMARQLMETHPTFRKMMEYCDRQLQPELDKSLLSVIYPETQTDEDLIHHTAYTQPALFAIEYSLAKLWQSWGVHPCVVMGHSVGEYTAACLAGVFSLDDGLKLISVRARLMQSLPRGGVMASIFAEENRVRAAIAPYAGQISIAALNGPNAVVISGMGSMVDQIIESLQQDGVRSQTLKVSHAFHSPLMDPILDEFERVAHSIQYHAPQIGMISNSGQLVTDDRMSNASYWREQMRQTVHFSEGVKTLGQEGYHFFLEIGPSPTLLGLASKCEPVRSDNVWLPSLRPERADWDQMLESLGQLYAHGYNIAWEAFEGDYKEQRRRIELPTYPFQRQRYWMDFEPVSHISSQIKTGHPLLGSRLSTALPIFQNQLSDIHPSYLADHRIHDITILPASAYVEIALAAAKNILDAERYSLEDISFREALAFSENERFTTQLVLTPNADGTSFQFFSRESGAQAETWRLHADGMLRIQADEASLPHSSLEDPRVRLSQSIPVEAYYERLAAVGADYGSAFRGIVEIHRTEGEALGRLELPAPLTGESEKYIIHPALLDACFQLLGAAMPENPENNTVYVPVGIQKLQIHGRIGASIYCHVKLRPTTQASARNLIGDLTLFNNAQTVIAEVKGLGLQQVSQQALQRASKVDVEDWLYEVKWLEQSRGASQVSWRGPGSWLVFADEDATSQEFVAHLTKKGEVCHLVHPGERFARQQQNEWLVNPLQVEDFKQLLSAIQNENQPPLRGVVHLWSLRESTDDDAELDDLHALQSRTLASVLHLTQALALHSTAQARLWLVTKGAQAVHGEPVNPALFTLWGLGNVIALEQPSLSCARIDLDPSDLNGSVLFDNIWEADEEDQIAWRDGKRYVARLVHGQVNASMQKENRPVELRIEARGVLDNLSLQPCERHHPDANQIEIEVHATGLNFRDVLNVLGMYPGDAGPLGSECAGTVTAVGEDVSDFEIGDEVIALTNHGFSSYVTVPSIFAVRKPSSLSFEESASIPIAFLTADYALNRLANMKQGDRVLIHTAAGGVGMAAVQLAKRAGAEIFGTAGSNEKRDLLRSLGVNHVLNSRTLDFSDEILSATNGEGVDIVLNSLAGDFIPRSLFVLKDTGCFIEIGKTDVWDEKRVRQLKGDIGYFVLYLGEILQKDPALIHEMLVNLLKDFEQGHLKPLPQTVFPLENAVDAFRFMAQAKHIGKIVITHPRGPSAAAPHAKATYLITGGLGGLGLVCARWLVEQGARHLVLMGRNGPSTDAQETLAELKAAGAEIHIAQADVSRTKDVEKVLHLISEAMPPLKGVIHAAGLLDDGIVLEQTWTRFAPVMAPKVNGAWNLHRLTRAMSLDFFVMFSAGASLLGSPGQANYASANAFLDGLAHYRRQEGLPAISINWGAWADVGMASRVTGHNQRRWALQGMAQIRPADGTRVLEELLKLQPVQMAVLPMNWQKIKPREDGSVRPLVRLLVKGPATDQLASQNIKRVTFLDQLKATPIEEQRKFLFQHIVNEVNRVLGLDASDSPNPHQGFTDIGLDSLMAVELSNRLRTDLERPLPPTLTFEYPTIHALTDYLATEILNMPSTKVTQNSISESNDQAIRSEVESIPEDQLEDALLKELKEAGY